VDQNELETQLRRVPLFQAMTDAAIAAIAEHVEEVGFEPGARLTEEGAAGDAFFVLTTGAALVARGGATVRSLGPGDFVGEISLIDGKPRTATVTATAPVRALVVRRAAFLGLLDRFPSVRLGVLMALTERIRSDARQPTD
jgi:CRP/FNR family cyclic AMP-dependent transcriptional regulator